MRPISCAHCMTTMLSSQTTFSARSLLAGDDRGVGSVNWNVASFSFELRSSDALLLQRARTIFRPWRLEQSAVPFRRWFVERASQSAPGARDDWKIQSNTTPEVCYQRTVEGALMLVEYQAVQTLVESPASPPTLHSALVAKNGVGALIIGPGEAGKSTLACALWQRGWSLLSDDGTLLDASVEQCHARPIPRRVSLRFPSRAHLGDELWERVLTTPSCDQTSEGVLFHPDEIDGRERSVAPRIIAAIFLSRRGKRLAPASLERMNPAQALLALLPYTNLIGWLNPGEAINRLRPIAETVPAYDLGRGNLAVMAERIESLVNGGA